jgi:hypothetical protein
MGRILGIVVAFLAVLLFEVTGFKGLGFILLLLFLAGGVVVWRRGQTRPPDRRLQDRIALGDPPPLVVRTYRTDAEFEQDAEALQKLGYVIESQHIGPRAGARGRIQSDWHVTYVRSPVNRPDPRGSNSTNL